MGRRYVYFDWTGRSFLYHDAWAEQYRRVPLHVVLALPLGPSPDLTELPVARGLRVLTGCWPRDRA